MVRRGSRFQLADALAPDAAYWRETQYESAAASKRYFTWYVDLADLASRQPSNGGQLNGGPLHGGPRACDPTSTAIDRLLRALQPLTAS